jgi:hypothetical protein
MSLFFLLRQRPCLGLWGYWGVLSLRFFVALWLIGGVVVLYWWLKGQSILLQRGGEVHNSESLDSKGGASQWDSLSSRATGGTGKTWTIDRRGRSSSYSNDQGDSRHEKASEVLTAYFQNTSGQLRDKFFRGQVDSNLSSPGSCTPVELVDVEVVEEARWTMQSPLKLKMGPLLAEMATMAPRGSHGTLDKLSLGIVLMGWNNLLVNGGKLSEEIFSQNSNKRQSIKKLFQPLCQISKQALISWMSRSNSCSQGLEMFW